MSRSIQLLVAAKRDLLDACEWYASVRPGLGAEFKGCVDDCIARIQENPEAFPFMQKQIRRAKLRRFRHIIIYGLTDNAIVIYAVFHSSRNPRILKQRLRERP